MVVLIKGGKKMKESITLLDGTVIKRTVKSVWPFRIIRYKNEDYVLHYNSNKVSHKLVESQYAH